MKTHNTTSLIFIERQGKKVLLRNAVDNQGRKISEAEAMPAFAAAREEAVMSSVLCQQKKWGAGFLFQVFKCED